MKHLTPLRLLLLAMVACVAFVHVFRLSTVPDGIYQDESAIGLNAARIADSGADEYGTFLPVYFRSFNDYKAPVFIYSAALVELIAGPSVVTVRLTSVLWFFLLLYGAWTLTQLLWRRDDRLLLSCVLIVGFMPWLFTISRIAFEVISQGALLLWTLVFAFRTFEMRSKKTVDACMTGLLTGLLFYSYPTSRLLVPLFLICLFGLYAREKNKRDVMLMIAAGVITAIPLLYFMIETPDGLLSRFSGITYIFDESLTIAEKLSQFITNYAAYFKPDFLLLHGDSNMRHATGFGGQLLFPVFILGLLGIGNTFLSRKTHEKFWFLLLLLLVLSPMPAALTNDGTPHALRSLSLGILWIVFAIRGMHIILSVRPEKVANIFFGFTMVVLVHAGVLYAVHYFTDYPAISASAFETAGLAEAVEKAKEWKPTEILISDSINAAHGLFYSQIALEKDWPKIRVGRPVMVMGGCLIERLGDSVPEGPSQTIVDLPERSSVRLICYR